MMQVDEETRESSWGWHDEDGPNLLKNANDETLVQLQVIE